MPKASPNNTQLSISTSKLLKIVGYIIIGFLLAHLLLQYLYWIHHIEIISTLRGRLNLDNEISIPTWFQQSILFIIGISGLLLAKLDVKNKIYWWLFSALFVYLSVDEGAMLHEAFIDKFRELTVSSSTTGIGVHTWLIPVALIIVLLLLPFIKFIRSLPKKVRLGLILGISVYVFGAIIYETIGLVFIHGDFAYHGINIAIEEGLEMLGMLIIFRTCLRYIKQITPKNISIKLVD